MRENNRIGAGAGAEERETEEAFEVGGGKAARDAVPAVEVEAPPARRVSRRSAPRGAAEGHSSDEIVDRELLEDTDEEILVQIFPPRPSAALRHFPCLRSRRKDEHAR